MADPERIGNAIRIRSRLFGWRVRQREI